MDFKIEWSPTAKWDLRDILLYISEDNPGAARRVRDDILNVVLSLPDFPASGRVVPEFRQENLRELIQRPYRIVYRVRRAKHVLEIVRIWHAARGTPEV